MTEGPSRIQALNTAQRFCVSPHPQGCQRNHSTFELSAQAVHPQIMAKFVIHGCPHHTTHSCAVIKLLQVSVSHSTRSIGSKFFRCLIHKDVQILSYSKMIFSFRYQLSKLGLISLSLSNSEWRDSMLAIAERKNKSLLVYELLLIPKIWTLV